MLSVSEAIDAVADALMAYSAGEAVSPVRLSVPVPSQAATSLFMPALVENLGGLGLKFVSVFPHNQAQGKKTINGVVVLAHAETGEPLAMLEASYLTALRTGAASGLATKLLARPDAATVALIGTGGQAGMLLRSIQAVRDIRDVRVYSRTRANAERFAAAMAEEFAGAGISYRAMDSAAAAVDGADIVVTATNSETPVFPAGLIAPGTHINAVGSFRPTMQELPDGVVSKQAKVVVECRHAALEESGDLVKPIAAGLFEPDDIYAELGEIAAGRRPGRQSPDEITVFKSVGLAAMDIVVGKAMYDRAVKQNMGTIVDLGE